MSAFLAGSRENGGPLLLPCASLPKFLFRDFSSAATGPSTYWGAVSTYASTASGETFSGSSLTVRADCSFWIQEYYRNAQPRPMRSAPFTASYLST